MTTQTNLFLHLKITWLSSIKSGNKSCWLFISVTSLDMCKFKTQVCEFNSEKNNHSLYLLYWVPMESEFAGQSSTEIPASLNSLATCSVSTRTSRNLDPVEDMATWYGDSCACSWRTWNNAVFTKMRQAFVRLHYITWLTYLFKLVHFIL